MDPLFTVELRIETMLMPVVLRKIPVAAPVSVRVRVSESVPVPPTCARVRVRVSIVPPRRFLDPSSRVAKMTFAASDREVCVTPLVFVRARRSTGCLTRLDPPLSSVREIVPPFVTAPVT